MISGPMVPNNNTVVRIGRKFGVLVESSSKRKVMKAKIGAFIKSEIPSARSSMMPLLIGLAFILTRPVN